MAKIQCLIQPRISRDHSNNDSQKNICHIDRSDNEGNICERNIDGTVYSCKKDDLIAQSSFGLL